MRTSDDECLAGRVAPSRVKNALADPRYGGGNATDLAFETLIFS